MLGGFVTSACVIGAIAVWSNWHRGYVPDDPPGPPGYEVDYFADKVPWEKLG